MTGVSVSACIPRSNLWPIPMEPAFDEAPDPKGPRTSRPPYRCRPAANSAIENKNAVRDRVVLEHLPLARSIALRLHETLPVHIDVDDLTHAGILGLFDAATKFDATKQVAFSTYAKHRIKGAILDSLRQLDWASRDLRRRFRQFEAVTRELAGELHRAPTETEMAERLGVSVERWREMTLEMRNVGLISADTRSADHDELPAPEYAGPTDVEPDKMCAREQLRAALGAAMRVLPERYQQVVMLYYRNDMTMKQIGHILGINESRVSQIHKAALQKMHGALHGAGIHSSSAF